MLAASEGHKKGEKYYQQQRRCSLCREWDFRSLQMQSAVTVKLDSLDAEFSLHQT